MSGGFEADTSGRLYISAYEYNTILRRSPDGTYEMIAHDPRMLWVDTMSLTSNGYLYFTTNQINRQPASHSGRDLRQKQYMLWRIKIDASPVQLR